MSDKFKIGAALLLLLTVVYIFVAPTFDLDPTALRAARHAASIFIAIAAAASVLTALETGLQSILISPSAPIPPASDLIDLTCTRLC